MKAAAADQKALRKQIQSLEVELQKALEKNREQAKTISLIHSRGQVPVSKSGYYLVPMKSTPGGDSNEAGSGALPEEGIRDTWHGTPDASPLIAPVSHVPPNETPANRDAETMIPGNEEDTEGTVYTLPSLPPPGPEQPRHAAETKSQSIRKDSESKRRQERDATLTEGNEKEVRQSPRVVLPFELEEMARREMKKTQQEEEVQRLQAETALKLERERAGRVEAVKQRMAKKEADEKKEEEEKHNHAQHMQRLKSGLRQIKSEDASRWT